MYNNSGDNFFAGVLGFVIGVIICCLIAASDERDEQAMTAMDKYEDCVLEQYGMTVYAYRENNDNKMPVCNFNQR